MEVEVRKPRRWNEPRRHRFALVKDQKPSDDHEWLKRDRRPTEMERWNYQQAMLMRRFEEHQWFLHQLNLQRHQQFFAPPPFNHGTQQQLPPLPPWYPVNHDGLYDVYDDRDNRDWGRGHGRRHRHVGRGDREPLLITREPRAHERNQSPNGSSSSSSSSPSSSDSSDSDNSKGERKKKKKKKKKKTQANMKKVTQRSGRRRPGYGGGYTDDSANESH